MISMERSSRKVPLAFLFLIALNAVIAVGGAVAIGDLPSIQRQAAWRWFWAGWVVVAFSATISMVPQWRAGTIIPKSQAEQAANMQRTKTMAALGVPLGLLGGALSFLGASFWAAVGAVVGGLATAVLLLAVALHTTRKGRAMLRRVR
jgi:hypothetical protein